MSAQGGHWRIYALNSEDINIKSHNHEAYIPVPTFVFLEVQCILLVGDDLLQVDNVGVVQLPEDLDFPYSCDGKTLLLIFQAHLLQSHQLIWKQPFTNNTAQIQALIMINVKQISQWDLRDF